MSSTKKTVVQRVTKGRSDSQHGTGLLSKGVVANDDYMAMWGRCVSAWEACHGPIDCDNRKVDTVSSSSNLQCKLVEEVQASNLAKLAETWNVVPVSTGHDVPDSGVDPHSTAAQIAEDVLAGLDFSFDEKGKEVGPESEAKFAGILVDGMVTDVWMADGAPELLFATRLLFPSASENLLPKRGVTADDGVLILFCPKGSGCPSRPSVMDLCSGEVRPCRRRSFEEEIYSKAGGLRAVVVPSERLDGRCVLLAQISAQEIQAYGKEPSLDAALSYWSGPVGRHVFFWSPLTSQAGVLSENEWWDKRFVEGRFHQVLCNLDMLEDSERDVGSPVEGTIKNFGHHVAEKFYGASWTHVCRDVAVEANRETDDVAQKLLSALDEGSRGMLRSYRVPQPICPKEVARGIVHEHSTISLALLRVYLENVECAVAALAGQSRIAQSDLGSVFNALYASASKLMVNCGNAGLDALGRCLLTRMAMSAADDLVREVAQTVVSVRNEVAKGKTPTTDFYRRLVGTISLEEAVARSLDALVGKVARMNGLIASCECELCKSPDVDGADSGKDDGLPRILLLLRSHAIMSSLRTNGDFAVKLGKLIKSAVLKPGDVALSRNERRLLAALEAEHRRLVAEADRLREWLEGQTDETLPGLMCQCLLELSGVVPCEVAVMVSLIGK